MHGKREAAPHHRGRNLSEEEVIKLENTRTFMQHEIGQVLKLATYQGGVSIADVAEELKWFYDADEIAYLKSIL